MSEKQNFSCDELEALMFAALVNAKTSEKNARAVAKALLAAEIDGRKGHGFSRVPSYAGQAISGKCNGMAVPEIIKELPGSLTIDAHHGFFYPAIDLAIEHVLVKARTNGIAAVAFHNSHHCGVLGHHVEKIAEAGLIALLMGNTPQAMAPWGGTTPIYGTQPLAFASPRINSLPLVMDMALTQVARGNIMTASQAGKPIPEGWATDAKGNPTTDPDVALSEGVLLPMGGAKGAALGLMIEILCGPLTGSALSTEASSFFTTDGEPPSVGQFLIAIDPDAFSGRDHFLERVEVIMESITSQDGARIPGARRAALRKQAAENGLSVPANLVEEVKAIAGQAD
ncbi:MAG: Ldh family oxidoreductase [Alphaproteobacteria bacterium]